MVPKVSDIAPLVISEFFHLPTTWRAKLYAKILFHSVEIKEYFTPWRKHKGSGSNSYQPVNLQERKLAIWDEVLVFRTQTLKQVRRKDSHTWPLPINDVRCITSKLKGTIWLTAFIPSSLASSFRQISRFEKKEIPVGYRFIIGQPFLPKFAILSCYMGNLT